MNLRWMLRRLLAMPPGEVAYRTRLALRDKLDARHAAAVASTPPESLLPEAFQLHDGPESFEVRLLEHLRQRRSPRFFFDHHEREQIIALFREHYPDGLEDTRAAAERAAAGKFWLFGREVDLGNPIDWSKDHLTGRSWPKTYARSIDIRDTEAVGGIKYAWEPSRHLHWMSLARAWFLTGEEKYALALASQWESWLDDNPPLTGVQWTYSLEMAIRVFTWSWCLNWLLPWENLDPKLVARMMGSLLLQVRFIARNLSFYSSANNHLIGEVSGLTFAGILYPEFLDAGNWRRTGIRILNREVVKQVYPDGVDAEQATHYQTFVLDLYLQSYLLAANNNIELSPDVPHHMERMIDFLGAILNARGIMPIIGDMDDGEAVHLAESKPGDARSLLATGAALFRRADFTALSGRFDERSWWLLGESGRSTFESLAPDDSPRKSRAFENGGYYVMRAGEGDSERLLVADCGPLGYLSLAGHGHADCLSFVMSLGGYPILVDPGNFCYHEKPDWRRYFRSTGAHNTIMVDDQDQSQMLGAFLWGQRAKAEALCWESTPAYDYFCGRHDGYVKSCGIIHQRRILFLKPDVWMLVDELNGEGEHRWERRFHFSPGEVEVDAAKKQIHAVRDGQMLALAWLEDESGDLVIGRENPILGWYSPSYGVKQPACCAVITGKGRTPRKLVTVLSAGEVPKVDKVGESEFALKYGDKAYSIRFLEDGSVKID